MVSPQASGPTRSRTRPARAGTILAAIEAGRPAGHPQAHRRPHRLAAFRPSAGSTPQATCPLVMFCERPPGAI
jgi:hypothetical protein